MLQIQYLISYQPGHEDVMEMLLSDDTPLESREYFYHVSKISDGGKSILQYTPEYSDPSYSATGNNCVPIITLETFAEKGEGIFLLSARLRPKIEVELLIFRIVMSVLICSVFVYSLLTTGFSVKSLFFFSTALLFINLAEILVPLRGIWISLSPFLKTFRKRLEEITGADVTYTEVHDFGLWEKVKGFFDRTGKRKKKMHP